MKLTHVLALALVAFSTVSAYAAEVKEEPKEVVEVKAADEAVEVKVAEKK